MVLTSIAEATPSPNIRAYGSKFNEKPCLFFSNMLKNDSFLSEYGG